MSNDKATATVRPMTGVTVTSSGNLHVTTTSVIGSDDYQRRLNNMDRIFEAGAKGLINNVRINSSKNKP